MLPPFRLVWRMKSHKEKKQVSCQIHVDAIFEATSGFTGIGVLEEWSESLVCEACIPYNSLGYLWCSLSNGIRSHPFFRAVGSAKPRM